ncbi:MAG: CpsD/CapB family tyrosine-protein kinase [Sedimenticola sp.]
MDRIEKALQQAKAEQAKSKRGGTVDVLGGADPINETTSDGNAKVQPQYISYSKTKVIKATPEVYAESRLIAALKHDPRSTSFRMLRTQILKTLRKNQWNSIAVTAATQGAGKSFVAANLAVSISTEVNQTVMLVDLDMRRPTIHRYFGFKPEHGLQDYLTGKVELESVLVNPGMERLVVLPGRGTHPESSELISTPRMRDLSHELKTRYKARIVIYDLPPVLAVDDAMVFMPHADAALFVVENGVNTEDEVRRSMNLLGATNLLGTVLNKAEERNSDYYYGYN